MVDKNQIKKLIENGFDIELVAFEFNIPIEKIIECKKEIEQQRINEIISKRNSEAHNKMRKARKKYQKLFVDKKNIEIKEDEESCSLSEQEKKQIEHVIKEVKEKGEKIKGCSKNEKRDIAIEILRELKKIKGYQLSVEQAEILQNLMKEKEFFNLNRYSSDKMDPILEIKRKQIDINMIMAIKIAYKKTDDIEELKNLRKKITPEMQKRIPIIISPIEHNIDSKISKISTERAKSTIRNNIPVNIENIIHDLAEGKIDIDNANKVIDEEARKRTEGKNKNIFKLTEIQERRQLLMQIRIALSENPDQFFIKKPYETIEQLKMLTNGEEVVAITSVVNNLIRRKDLEKAKEICKKFKHDEKVKNMTHLEQEIMKVELSDKILKAINSDMTPNEERVFIETLENELRILNLSPRAILLGKSEDGSKNISLADILEEENERKI